jgi:hypothetical protein
MANDDDDDGEFSPMPPLPVVANGEEHQWGESFSPLSSFGSLEQEGEKMKMNTLSRMMMTVMMMTVE